MQLGCIPVGLVWEAIVNTEVYLHDVGVTLIGVKPPVGTNALLDPNWMMELAYLLLVICTL